MSASRCSLKLGALVLLSLHSVTRLALAQTGVQAELTALLDSGNLLGGPIPAPPPWENLASPQSGRQSRTRLAVGKNDAGLWPGLRTSALLRLDLALEPGEPVELRDVSSFVGVAWRLRHSSELSLRAYPFDTDYLRVGYLHALDWGGTDVERGESVFLSQKGGVPGVELGLSTQRVRLMAALKWAKASDALAGAQRLWGVMTGSHFELAAALSADAGFGYFERPVVPLSQASSFVEGASLRVVWHRGPSEPELADEPFRPPTLREEPFQLTADAVHGFALALEAVTLVVRQRRFEDPRLETLGAAPAAALYGSFRGQLLAGHAVLSWRSLPFVLRSNPSVAPGETLPQRSAALAELSAWLGGSFTLPHGLVPSLEIGLRLPAALETPSALPGFTQTLVVAAAGADFTALPVGAGRLPVLAVRVGARCQASSSVALLLFAEYQRDPNQALFTASPSGASRSFASPDALSLLGAAQARF